MIMLTTTTIKKIYPVKFPNLPLFATVKSKDPQDVSKIDFKEDPSGLKFERSLKIKVPQRPRIKMDVAISKR